MRGGCDRRHAGAVPGSLYHQLCRCGASDNHYKNEYVKSSGYRYVDFAKAVGAENAGSQWYNGMLASDKIHPTKTGARALYQQVICDFPEITLK